jgi:hypothetical protein
MTTTSPTPPALATGGRRLCESPLIHVFDDILTAEECAHIVETARPRMRRSQVSGEAGGKLSPGRTSERAWLKHAEDLSVLAVADRVAALRRPPAAHAESLQVVHYDTGEEYRPHFDAYDISTEKGQRYTARGGQRLVTALTYLSNVARPAPPASPTSASTCRRAAARSWCSTTATPARPPATPAATTRASASASATSGPSICGSTSAPTS